MIKLNDNHDLLNRYREFIREKNLQDEFERYLDQGSRKDSNEEVVMFDGIPIPGGLRRIDKDD